MKTGTRTLLLVLIAVAAALWWGLARCGTPPAAPKPVAALPAPADATVFALREDIARLQRENEDLRARLAAAERRQQALRPAQPTVAAGTDEAAAPFFGFDSVLDNEETRQEVRNMLRQQQEALVARRVEQDYGEFLQGPAIPPEQRDALTDLLARRHLEDVMAPLDLIFEQGAEFDPQQMQTTHDRQQEAAGAVDDEIRALLTPEAFGAYEYHRETIGARGEVESIQVQLAARGLGLTREQEKALVGIVYLEGAGDAAPPMEETAFNMQVVFGPGEDYGSAMAEKLDYSAEAYNRILEASKAALDAEQYDALLAYYQERLEQQEQQADITEAMAPLFRDLMQKGVGE